MCLMAFSQLEAPPAPRTPQDSPWALLTPSVPGWICFSPVSGQWGSASPARQGTHPQASVTLGGIMLWESGGAGEETDRNSHSQLPVPPGLAQVRAP